jgi:RNA polymerase sigma factor (sigma-70 family)
MTEKEKVLLEGCLKAEKAAWDALVLRYSSLVYHTIKKTFALYHSEPRPDSVEDLFQEFFLSILRDDFKKLRQFRGERGCSLASWLRVIAARLTVDFLRKQGPARVEVADTVPFEGPDPPASVIQREEEEMLVQTLQSLSAPDRIFIDLCFRQGLPPEDIAAILKVSVNAVYTQKSRILDKLRESLKKNQVL